MWAADLLTQLLKVMTSSYPQPRRATIPAHLFLVLHIRKTGSWGVIESQQERESREKVS